MEPISIADKLKEIRKRLNLTGEEIGRRAGVSRSYIARLESGEIPSLERAFKIEKALNLSGEISDLVIQEAQRTAGLNPTRLRDAQHVDLLKKDNNTSFNLEAIWLTHNCPNCGTKAPIKLSIS